MKNSKTASASEAKTDATPETKPAEKPAPKPKTPAQKKSGKAKAAPTLADACRAYLEHMEADGKSTGTLSSYRSELLLACKHLGADTALSKITTAKVAEYFESDPVTKLRTGKPKAKPSIDKTRRVLRLCLVHAEQKKLVKAAPIPEPVAKA